MLKTVTAGACLICWVISTSLPVGQALDVTLGHLSSFEDYPGWGPALDMAVEKARELGLLQGINITYVGKPTLLSVQCKIAASLLLQFVMFLRGDISDFSRR